MTWDVSGPSVGFSKLKMGRLWQPADTYICLYWRTMWSEPLTHSTVMSWHTIATAQLWTISRARFPPSDSWTNLRALYGAAPKMILSQTFHHSLFIKLRQPPKVKTCNWGNSTKSTIHQRGIMEHPIWIEIWLHAWGHKHRVENCDRQSKLVFLQWILCNCRNDHLKKCGRKKIALSPCGVS